MAAISWVDETWVVVRFSPCACTTEKEQKLLPLTVRLKAGATDSDRMGSRIVILGNPLATVTATGGRFHRPAED